MGERRVCPNCKEETTLDASFCELCATKISEICPACWKMNRQPSSCPGHVCGDKPILVKNQ